MTNNENELNDLLANIRTHIPDFDMASKIMKLCRDGYTRPQPSADVSNDLEKVFKVLGMNNLYSSEMGLIHQKLSRALTQPKAVDKAVDVEGLTESIIASMKGYTIHDRYLSHTVANIIAKYLSKQGYLNTNERVQELEKKLKVAKEVEGGTTAKV